MASDTKIEFHKHPLSIEQQIEKLSNRGLIFDNKKLAASFLSNISYYRLRAYTYPFQNNEDEEFEHQFIRDDVHFEDIIALYRFDRQLRLLIFNAIEKIEVAIRTKITQLYSESSGNSHWYLDNRFYKSSAKLDCLFDEIKSDIHRSNEDFIKHYNKKYNNPELPPSWMALEVVSFGALSKLYKSLAKNDNKIAVARQLGITDVELMANWLHAFANLRNSCAHHSRIWNRRFIVRIKLPYNTIRPFMNRNSLKTVKQNKLYALLSCIKYCSDILSPDNQFKSQLFNLLNKGGKLLTFKDMGFPDNWKHEPVWK